MCRREIILIFQFATIHVLIAQCFGRRPSQTYTRPSQTYTRPSQMYTRPSQTYTRPSQTYTRPLLTYTRLSINSLKCSVRFWSLSTRGSQIGNYSNVYNDAMGNTQSLCQTTHPTFQNLTAPSEPPLAKKSSYMGCQDTTESQFRHRK